jgi:hypothetical protein
MHKCNGSCSSFCPFDYFNTIVAVLSATVMPG